ncbi:chromosome partitioning protein ParA [Porphyrobacter sp. TH134]|uniref:ParA family protein n=1 Tax=Porphyrobacter sp. TH134 TaxID=2067450 RepID=UPI000C7E2205|nr:AAA family ATPase [Porphyrobacter sp. TH134]PLK28161.1 chromosome partitioning protein ParA [Porphyrobacter sp. TH134]
MSRRIVFFNHKGGVSKTTSAYNIGWMLAREKRVLLVDADPQCNLSALILRDEFEKYYVEDATKHQNLKDGVSSTFGGKPVPIEPVMCATPARAPNLHLLAGHMNLSEYDASLTFAQTANNALATLQNLPGAFAELLRLTEDAYDIDYTLIDLNPGLSAINQNLFLISDGFVIPTNPDPFSLMAIQTLASVLPRWVSWKNGAVELFAESAYPLPAGVPKLVGSLIQRFNVRNGVAARPYRNNIDEIKATVSNILYPTLRDNGMVFDAACYGEKLVEANYCLAEIPDFQGLLPKSNAANVPVFEVTNAEIGETGPVLANLIQNRDRFEGNFRNIVAQIEQVIACA